MKSLSGGRLLIVALVALRCAPCSRANQAADLVRIHLEALGGSERIAALKGMRATGKVMAAGKIMRFTLIAERPNMIRLETENGTRTLVQASNGREPPWEFDTGQWPPRYRDMPAGVAKTFVADAEFDDPLVAGASRGFTIEEAGEVENDGKKLIRLLVTRNLTETSALLLDPQTFFIVKRIEDRKNPLGGVTHVVTYYSDYRPVDGVLIPHRIALVIDGRITQQTQIDSIQPNPDVASDTFSHAKAGG